MGWFYDIYKHKIQKFSGYTINSLFNVYMAKKQDTFTDKIINAWLNNKIGVSMFGKTPCIHVDIKRV